MDSLLFALKEADTGSMKKLIEHSVFSLNLSKTLLYSMEYRALYQLSKRLSYFVKPPHREQRKELMDFLRDGVIGLHRSDARNVAEGVYPFTVVIPKAAKEHLTNFPKILLDSLRISRRRKLNVNKEINAE